MSSRILLDVIAEFNRWWITVAVMLSLLLQILLLLTGGSRKWNQGFRFTAWMAYNWSDYIATTALGGMAQASAGDNGGKGNEVYALWAPFLLLHLGAPDNIAAYAMADAELWQRHGLTMVLQIIVAIYVVVRSARGWKFVLLSACITTLGSIKYAERTFALKQASHDDITKSSLPIYKYMLAESQMHLEVKGAILSQDGCHQIARDSSAPTYYYIIIGDEQWLHNFQQAGDSIYIHDYTNAAKATSGLVTLQDILSSRDLTIQTPSIVLTCIGFALFKLYKRRLCNLYMYEWRVGKTRDFFLGKHVFADEEKLMFTLDVELRFLFDILYTKAAGTAFSKMGVIYRIVTASLLVVCAVFILGGSLDFRDQELQQARDVTFCLISVALIIEFYQLLRLVLSDWCRVWLACRYIIVGEKIREKSLKSGSLNCLGCYWLASLLLILMRISSSFGRHKYWTNRIGQYALVSPRKMNVHLTAKLKLVDWFRRKGLPEYEQSKQAVEEFKGYVLCKLMEACREIDANSKVTNLDWLLRRYEGRHRSILQETLFEAGYYDFEHATVCWHVATCALELLATSAVRSMQQEQDVRVSKLLSRYLMYLLVHKAELLPCHAEIGRLLARDTQKQMQNSEFVWDVQHVSAVLRDPEPNMEQLPSNLRPGMKAGRLLQDLDPQERWSLVGSVWVYILMTAAACNKPAEQLRQLTLGGEFLTRIWVLLGHLGLGDQ